MWTTNITPRAGETDMFGHINNITLACWFESGRNAMFDLFLQSPKKSGEVAKAPFIMAHAEYDYQKQLFFRPPVEIRAWIEKIGNKSFTIYEECWQNGQCCATGRFVVVWFDYEAQTTVRVPDFARDELSKHLFTSSPSPRLPARFPSPDS
jgi:acyl-CoA thioester hydrolase